MNIQFSSNTVVICSKTGTCNKTEEDFTIPEDAQPSTEEEEALHKRLGEVEISPLSITIFKLQILI